MTIPNKDYFPNMLLVVPLDMVISRFQYVKLVIGGMELNAQLVLPIHINWSLETMEHVKVVPVILQHEG